MKNILILGSSGFIGKNLTIYLRDKFNIYTPSSDELNVLDGLAVEKYVKRSNFDIVLNTLDRRMHKNMPNSESVYVIERLRMFQNIARLSDYYGKMLYYGTGAEYGRTLPVESIMEDDFGRIIPNDYYGFLMYTMQKLAFQNRNTTNFRLFGIFGPYEVYQHRFISNAICKALCGYPITIRQDAIFDYLHTDDLCELTKYYINNEMTHQAYNASSGQRMKLSQIASIVREHVSPSIPIYIANSGFKKEYTASNLLLIQESKCVIGAIVDHIKSLIEFYSQRIRELDRESLLYNS